MDTRHILRELLREELNLGARADGFADDTPLLGAVPELDSMAVVAVITAMEERFGVTLDDADIDGSTFATFGSLHGFIREHLAT
ncbi:MAG: acyl carrier protein [Gammaproteobacteria bacterium]|nr:acyl carrier protein [Gammaproteobacteria bacterium]MBU0770780.1 acyl carrier protein [Gammaproteobacteria bacterium]MBU0856742.1 acyl carrier protein [Gammaproteobacteria bacterium]MBU1845577.1 acyl carrier protein [Gammaproteobacteria bacterium]